MRNTLFFNRISSDLSFAAFANEISVEAGSERRHSGQSWLELLPMARPNQEIQYAPLGMAKTNMSLPLLDMR